MKNEVLNLDQLASHIIAVANNIDLPITNLHLQKATYFAFKYAIKCAQQNKLFKLSDLKAIYQNSQPFCTSLYGPINIQIYDSFKDFGATPIKYFTTPSRYFNKALMNNEIIGLVRTNPFDLVKKARQEPFWQNHKSKHHINYPFQVLLK